MVKYQRGGVAVDPFEWRDRVVIGELFQALSYQFAGVSMALGLEFTLTPPERPIFVLFDRESLADVISSLVHNAFAACEKGGAVALRGQAEGLNCRITVVDSGPGIAPGALEAIFAPGYPRRGRDGFTLNLFQIRAVVESMGGTIRAANRARGGARFTLILPCA